MLTFVFPGQGTQRPGMGRLFCRTSPAAAAVFEEASAVLGIDMAALCSSGPADHLTRTENAQPAILTCNLAALALLAERGIHPDATAGHSVGELAALVAAGVLEAPDALRLVRTRATLMSRLPGDGAMTAVIGIPTATVVELCERAEGTVVPAVWNGPENVVVSGERGAVERCAELARAAGALRTLPLVVSHAFHSPLMEPALEDWRAAVATVPMRAPQIRLALNKVGAEVAEPEAIRAAVVDQLVSPVRWWQCMEALLQAGTELVVEAGDARVLSTLHRHISRSVPALTLGQPGGWARVEQAVSERTTSAPVPSLVSGGE